MAVGEQVGWGVSDEALSPFLKPEIRRRDIWHGRLRKLIAELEAVIVSGAGLTVIEPAT